MQPAEHSVRWQLVMHVWTGDASYRMEPTTLYTATVIGSIALFLVLRPGRTGLRIGAGLLALGAVGWILGNLPSFFDDGHGSRPEVIFIFFAVLAIGSAGRMITHTKPVYSALHFILVVLASAGMFLLLSAEFMAFALVIVYAGAILVTYMFVLMLAQQAPNPQDPESTPEYDRVPREPMAAVVVGFIMLSLLGNLATNLDQSLPARPTNAAANAQAWDELSRMTAMLKKYAAEDAPEDSTVGLTIKDDMIALDVAPDGMSATFEYTSVGEEGAATHVCSLDADEHLPGNTQRVGMALVADFPVSLELAGIILLMAMFGAVVLARRQQELGEDVVRQAAGMRRLTVDHDDAEGAENEEASS